MIKKIEFLYFNGCPNSQPTFDNLIESLKDLDSKDINVERIEVNNLEEAQKFKFLGSPSIYVNGIDLYTLKKPDKFNYACRTFNINNKKTGILTKEFIKERLKNLL